MLQELTCSLKKEDAVRRTKEENKLKFTLINEEALDSHSKL